MSKKKDVVKGEGPVARIRENSRLMRTHETMVDFINGRHPERSLLDVFASGLLGSDFLHSFDGNLEDDIIYSDEDEDEDDDGGLYSQNSAHKPLEPHPRIKQLTDEEADKHAKELLEEEERRKEKTEKNKRKKMRKKAKKRLEKENAVKDILPEEERGKSDSDNKEECDETQNTTEEVKHDDGDNKDEDVVKTKEKEDEESKNLDLNNSYEETSKQRPARARRKDRSKLMEVQQVDEEKPTDVEKAVIQKKEEEEEEEEPETETGTEPAAEEFTKRSRELAGVGNRMASSGQYDMAVKYFTDAIRYNPKEFKLFGNRSLCFERMQQYENALRDADLALCMQPNWIKGLFRKGKALCGLKRYYEASLIYKEVLQLESSSTEAMQELKRAQTLHLMEMGFSWAQSSEALKTHATLEAAVEALFGDLSLSRAVDAAASKDATERPAVPDEGGDDSEWIVRQMSRPRMQQVREAEDSGQSRSKSQSPTPPLQNPVKVELFPVWVGSLAPAVTYATLHELFSRAGTVYSIKMLLEHQCAFVNYATKEDCDRAIHCINGMVVEGAPLSVRFPNKIHNGLGMSTDFNVWPGSYKKECFFWRTTGCTRSDCTYKHVPEHKNIDKDKFTSRLGNISM